MWKIQTSQSDCKLQVCEGCNQKSEQKIKDAPYPMSGLSEAETMKQLARAEFLSAQYITH